VTAMLEALRTWCELANMLKRSDRPVFAINDAHTAEWNRSALLSRMRYEHLLQPGLNWMFADAARDLTPYDSSPLRDLALLLSGLGFSTDLIVALLAAGHAPDDARAARDILNR
jgi:hypothetical protein